MRNHERPDFIPGEDPIAPAARLDFACQGCGGCCTDTTPYVTPYDVWRLARHLDASTASVLDRTVLDLPEEDGQPLLYISGTGAGECLWLDHASRRCRVYAVRPFSCRAFPIGVRHDARGDVLSKARTLPGCRGEGRGRQTVQAYLDESITPDDWRWSRAYAAVAREAFPPGEARVRDREYVSYYLHTLFDLDRLPGRDFAARFAEAAARLHRAAMTF